MQCILRGAALKKYKVVIRACKELTKDLAGGKWNLVDLKELSTAELWTWENSDGLIMTGMPS